MCIQNKFWQAQQHWIALGILVEAYTAAAKMARIGHVDHNDRNEHKHYSRRMWPRARTETAKVRTWYMNFHWVCRQNIRYRRGRRRSFTCQPFIARSITDLTIRVRKDGLLDSQRGDHQNARAIATVITRAWDAHIEWSGAHAER